MNNSSSTSLGNQQSSPLVVEPGQTIPDAMMKEQGSSGSIMAGKHFEILGFNPIIREQISDATPVRIETTLLKYVEYVAAVPTLASYDAVRDAYTKVRDEFSAAIGTAHKLLQQEDFQYEKLVSVQTDLFEQAAQFYHKGVHYLYLANKKSKSNGSKMERRFVGQLDVGEDAYNNVTHTLKLMNGEQEGSDDENEISDSDDDEEEEEAQLQALKASAQKSAEKLKQTLSRFKNSGLDGSYQQQSNVSTSGINATNKFSSSVKDKTSSFENHSYDQEVEYARKHLKQTSSGRSRKDANGKIMNSKNRTVQFLELGQESNTQENIASRQAEINQRLLELSIIREQDPGETFIKKRIEHPYTNVNPRGQDQRYREVEEDLNVRSTVAELARAVNRIEQKMNSQNSSVWEPTINKPDYANPELHYSRCHPLDAAYLTTMPEGFKERPYISGERFDIAIVTREGAIPKLTGSAEFEAWKAAFIYYVYRYQIRTIEKMNCLKSTIDMENPIIAEIMENLKVDEIGFRCALISLEDAFGGEETYNKALHDKLMSHQTININDVKGMRSFKQDLKKYVENCFRNGKADEVLKGHGIYRDLAPKFTSYSIRAHLTWLMDRRKEYSAVALLEWITEVTESHKKAAFLFDHPFVTATRSQKPVQAKGNVIGGVPIKQFHLTSEEFSHINDQAGSDENTCIEDAEAKFFEREEKEIFFAQNESRRQMICKKCGKNHLLEECKEFLAMSPKKRRQLITGACYNCLLSGHISKNCKKKPGCPCGRCHHRLLHESNEIRHTKVISNEAQVHLTSNDDAIEEELENSEKEQYYQ